MSNTYYLNTDELRGMQEKLNAGDRVILSASDRILPISNIDHQISRIRWFYGQHIHAAAAFGGIIKTKHIDNKGGAFSGIRVMCVHHIADIINLCFAIPIIC